MIAILGGLGAAIAWAVSTTCSSRSSRLLPPRTVVAWVMLFGLVLTAPIALAEGVPHALDATSGMWLLLGGAGNVAGLILTYGALRIGQLALVAPLVSTEGAIAALIALIAGEPLAASAVLTLALIATGVGLSSIPAGEHASLAGARHIEAVGLALGASIAFGGSLYATGRASALLPAAWVVLSARLIGTLALALPLFLARRMAISRQVLPLLLASGICEVLGFFAFTAGATHGIAVAAVLSSQFAVFAALAGYALFGERLARIQLVGVVLVVIGVATLSALRA
jgi:drug/metabolite transporter (DMT)-like permease